MDSIDYKLLEANINNNNPSQSTFKSKKQTRARSLFRAKFVVGQFVRNVLHYRRPLHKRASKTGEKGFFLPGESRQSIVTVPRHGSRRSSLRSRQSVLSLSSVKLFGETPDIFVTLPTARGRRMHRVHRGSGSSIASSDITGKQLRYSHPTATAVLTSSWIDDRTKSMESLGSSMMTRDLESRMSTPKTIDMARDFPGEVNVRKIARDSSYNFKDAKAVVDGIMPRSKASVVDLTASNIELPTYYKAYNPRAAPVQNSDQDIQKHRDAALEALNGRKVPEASQMSSAHHLPDSLLPGPPQTFLRLSLPANIGDGTFFDDTEAVADHQPVERPQYAKHDSLSFIPYSKFLDRQSSDATSKRHSAVSSLSPDKHDSLQSQRHRQVYASVENLNESFPSFDEALGSAMLKNSRSKGKAPKVPEAHKMNDNGFPIMATTRDSYSAMPKYEKRTVSSEELKASKKEEKRKSKLANTEKKTTESAHAEVRQSFLNRVRKSLVA